MRLWLIRHAESQENVVMKEILDAAYVHRTLKPGQEMLTAMDAAFSKFYTDVATNGDSPVSDLGLKQCEQLGEYLPQLLLEKAKKHEQGKIRVFVSAQLRCMVTCDSFMSKLYKETGLTARVKPVLREKPGLSLPADDEHFYEKFNALVEDGKLDEALEFKRNFQWQPCGANKAEYIERFPWATFDDTFPEEGPWSLEGFNLPQEEMARQKQMGDWVREMQQSYKDGDLVIIVAHGGSQGMLIRELLQTPPTVSFDDVRNTSITSLHLPPPGMPPVFNPGSGRLHSSLVPKGADVRLEFHSATPHLDGGHEFIEWGQSRGFKMPKSKL